MRSAPVLEPVIVPLPPWRIWSKFSFKCVIVSVNKSLHGKESVRVFLEEGLVGGPEGALAGRYQSLPLGAVLRHLHIPLEGTHRQ